MGIKLSLSTYEVDVTNMETGKTGTVEVQALDSGEAMAKVEAGGKFAADDARLVDDPLEDFNYVGSRHHY